MLPVIAIDIIVVLSILRASRRGLSNALPVFCFFAVLIPLECKLPIPGLFDLGATRIGILTLFWLFIASSRRTTWRVPQKGVMAAHVMWITCSALYSISVTTSIKQVIFQVSEYYLLYFLFIRVIDDIKTIHRILYAILLAMGVCCLLSLAEVYGSWSVINIFPRDSAFDPLIVEWGRGLRARSTFPHPILFGDALAMGIPISLYMLSIVKTRGQNVALWIICLLMFWAIYKTSSRGPWLAVCISSCLLLMFVRNRARTYVLGLASCSLFIILVRPGIRDVILNLIEATLNPASPVGASYEYRHALNDAVLKAVSSDPGRFLLGYGLGTFRQHGLEIPFLGAFKRWYTCDNNWALFLYETGSVGCVLSGIILMWPCVRMVRDYASFPRPEKYLSAVIFIVLTGFYFMLLSVAGYSWGQQGHMLWMIISISVVYSQIVRRDLKSRRLLQARVVEQRQPVQSEVGDGVGLDITV